MTPSWVNMNRIFVYPEKSIYIRIDQQGNKCYLFMIDTISSYICKSI